MHDRRPAGWLTNEGWLKIKTAQRGKFPVIGFVKDPTGVAALYPGKREWRELVYMGKAGTGWSRTKSSEIRKHRQSEVQAHQTDQEAEGHLG